jgi:hypothetical protein
MGKEAVESIGGVIAFLGFLFFVYKLIELFI